MEAPRLTINRLPEEVLYVTFSFLRIGDHASVRSVCKRWSALIEDPNMRRFGRKATRPSKAWCATKISTGSVSTTVQGAIAQIECVNDCILTVSGRSLSSWHRDGTINQSCLFTSPVTGLAKWGVDDELVVFSVRPSVRVVKADDLNEEIMRIEGSGFCILSKDTLVATDGRALIFKRLQSGLALQKSRRSSKRCKYSSSTVNTDMLITQLCGVWDGKILLVDAAQTGRLQLVEIHHENWQEGGSALLSCTQLDFNRVIMKDMVKEEKAKREKRQAASEKGSRGGKVVQTKQYASSGGADTQLSMGDEWRGKLVAMSCLPHYFASIGPWLFLQSSPKESNTLYVFHSSKPGKLAGRILHKSKVRSICMWRGFLLTGSGVTSADDNRIRCWKLRFEEKRRGSLVPSVPLVQEHAEDAVGSTTGHLEASCSLLSPSDNGSAPTFPEHQSTSKKRKRKQKKPSYFAKDKKMKNSGSKIVPRVRRGPRTQHSAFGYFNSMSVGKDGKLYCGCSKGYVLVYS